jgi:trimeric autotransporter adhesin
VTLTNAGTVAIAVGSVTVSANFRARLLTCGTTLRAGQSCAITVSFAPTVTGAIVGSLVIGNNGTVALTGTGVAPAAAVSPTPFSFGNQQVRAPSSPQVFVYANTGSVNLVVSTVTVGGLNPGDFAVTSDGCTGTTLAPGTTCNIAVVFTPRATGTRAATVRIRDAAGGATAQTIALSGAGVAPIIGFGATTYRFGAVTAPTLATLVLSNSGTAPYVLTGIGLSSGVHFQVAGGTCQAGISLAAGATCTVDILFSPQGTVRFQDTLTVSGAGMGTGAPAYGTTMSLSGW